MKICIVTDDNSGIKKEDINGLPIYIIRMPILINGECYFENNLSQDEFYKKQKECENIITSQPSPGEIIETWEKLLTKYDYILHIPMSSGLSSSCATAISLAEDFGGKVVVIDNHSISLTLKRSIYNALNLINDEKSPLEIKEILEKEHLNTSIYIMVDTLTYLKKGGRISSTSALIGNTLHLKPILSINGQKLEAKTKAIGLKNAKKALFDLIKNDLETKFKDVPLEELEFGLAYTYNLESANQFKEEFVKEFNPTRLVMDPLSLSIAVHIGPGSLALTISRIIK
jgi:DegV family protein with EDD domain